uniref:Uncharacterized protein n=1 Tax=Romanomermis culicivorax TaxID=13658 RepID=A0A915J1T8_ROMCU
MAMVIGRVVRFVDIDLFNGGFHLEILVKDDGVKAGEQGEAKSTANGMQVVRRRNQSPST